jgi:hypothetical protein
MLRAAGAGGCSAAAWRRCDARSGREGGRAGRLNLKVGTARHEGGEHEAQGAEPPERLFAKAVE